MASYIVWCIVWITWIVLGTSWFDGADCDGSGVLMYSLISQWLFLLVGGAFLMLGLLSLSCEEGS
jgi:hypothetical protein